MKEYILKEYNLHPQAQVQDFIKLIFQSEFGPGHLIADPQYAYNRLITEWESVKDLPREDAQEIGGGYVRLCLKGIDRRQLEKINTAFVTSANRKTGNEKGFTEKIDLLLDMIEKGRLPFDYNQSRQAVEEYMAEGIKPTSHTKIYHRHYTPAYRVISAELI